MQIEIIIKELARLGLADCTPADIKEMRNKDGVYLYRVQHGGNFFVLKYFENQEYTREIQNYNLLRQLSIPTIELLGQTDKALLLEDLDLSSNYKLAASTDLSDIEVAKVLALWYRQLHDQSMDYVRSAGSNFYREIDCITRESIAMIREKSGTHDNEVWLLLLDHLELIFQQVSKLGETLTYNDFYWTNMAISPDRTKAIMFDYNLLGVGFRYNDIRNVCNSLSPEAGKAFVEAYGGINEKEKILDDGLSILVNLVFAYRLPVFPKWAEESLDAVRSGELERAVRRILEI